MTPYIWTDDGEELWTDDGPIPDDNYEEDITPATDKEIEKHKHDDSSQPDDKEE